MILVFLKYLFGKILFEENPFDKYLFAGRDWPEGPMKADLLSHGSALHPWTSASISKKAFWIGFLSTQLDTRFDDTSDNKAFV